MTEAHASVKYIYIYIYIYQQGMYDWGTHAIYLFIYIYIHIFIYIYIYIYIPDQSIGHIMHWGSHASGWFMPWNGLKPSNLKSICLYVLMARSSVVIFIMPTTWPPASTSHPPSPPIIIWFNRLDFFRWHFSWDGWRRHFWWWCCWGSSSRRPDEDCASYCWWCRGCCPCSLWCPAWVLSACCWRLCPVWVSPFWVGPLQCCGVFAPRAAAAARQHPIWWWCCRRYWLHRWSRRLNHMDNIRHHWPQYLHLARLAFCHLVHLSFVLRWLGCVQRLYTLHHLALCCSLRSGKCVGQLTHHGLGLAAQSFNYIIYHFVLGTRWPDCQLWLLVRPACYWWLWPLLPQWCCWWRLSQIA